ncbi:MAG TPA: NADH-quinone oxidoreductase subunit C [Dissulfurispiraceae bacterium]|nr:NADH-quinone oxidoreductase subunit C [Dissulfurispiraceae bacterium]
MYAFSVAKYLREYYPDEVIDMAEFRGQISVIVRKERIKEIMRDLHDTPEFCFNFLEDLCGVDYHGDRTWRFEVVYHLYSVKHRHSIRIKALVSESDCNIDSIADVWGAAEWLERECYDMFGIRFAGHPDLRRVLMPEDWRGYPLRKDYPLRSRLLEHEWEGYTEVVNKARRYSQSNLRRE